MRLLNADVAVYIDDQIVALNLDGVDFEALQGHFVARGCGRVFEGFAQQVGGVDFHAGRDLAAEKRCQDEVQLGVVANFIDAGVAEAYGFSLAVGSKGNLGRQGESEADAGAGYLLAEVGVGLQTDDDSVIYEFELGVFGVDVTGGLGVSLEVVATVGAAEKLLLEGSLNGVAGDFEFDGAGRGAQAGQAQAGQQDSGDWEPTPICCHSSIVPRRRIYIQF
jgi:hypothetical protein